ncbi:hypothetical protein MMC13_005524 [Lambiella insularis]|nr:hypothetical protein [Lambiella insularis]
MALRSQLLRVIFLLIPLLLFYFTLQAFLRPSAHQFSPENEKPLLRQELIVASVKGDDTSWLYEHLPSWKPNIYVADNPRAPLTVPKNKGREAMVYLTYIIDKYDRLPDIMVFMHSLRYQWHNDDPIYDGVPMLRALQIPHILATGYVNLRCVWTLGCPSELTLQSPSDLPTTVAYPSAFAALFPSLPLPSVVGVACCAQFALTPSKIHSRPRSDYEHYRDWLLNTDLDDATSGRVMEYSWHIIFGQEAVHCPDAAECYCKVFGHCAWKCERDKCGEWWPFPPYATLPKGWPKEGWDGERRGEEELRRMRNVSVVSV